MQIVSGRNDLDTAPVNEQTQPVSYSDMASGPGTWHLLLVHGLYSWYMASAPGTWPLLLVHGLCSWYMASAPGTWQEVRRKRPKVVFRTKNSTALIARVPILTICVFHLRPETKDDEIKDVLYVENIKIVDMKCVSRPNSISKTYRIVIQGSAVKSTIEQDFWPNDVGCREWTHTSLDFNSFLCFLRKNSHTKILKKIISRNDLHISWDHDNVHRDYTYGTHAFKHKSIIDHFIVSSNIFDTIVDNSVIFVES